VKIAYLQAKSGGRDPLARLVGAGQEGARAPSEVATDEA